METINLEGHKLFKVSHGYFVKNNSVNDDTVASVLEKRGWICLNMYTGKGQGNTFVNKVEIGDYVYVCYGGDELFCIGKIITDSKPLDDETDKLIHEDGEWVYREIEIIKLPINKSVREFKQDRRFHMPSGNSTFYEVSKYVLEQINIDIFQPKFGIKFVNTMPTSTQTPIINENAGQISAAIINHPLNQILYGPPGTGKTYHTISHAVAIIEGEDLIAIKQEGEDGNRENVKNRFDEYVSRGYIKFCTFHQSMSYEEFVEGIKPIEPEMEGQPLIYKVVDGIFKQFCMDAKNTNSDDDDDDGDIDGVSDTGTPPQLEPLAVVSNAKQYDNYVAWVNTSPKKSVVIDSKFKVKYTIVDADSKRIEISRTKGDNGKRTKNKIVEYLNKFNPNTPVDQDQDMDKLHKELGGDASILWALANAIRNHHISSFNTPVATRLLNNLDGGIGASKNQQQNRFVLIIDEINRGNVSQIFGELITLIEDDKRIDAEEELRATLPYSRDNFGVPSNLHIIGTMNTADRSVEALDTALRRRFTFVPMLPEEAKLKPTTDGIDLSKMLKVLNDRLKILKDSDHTIGHAWLMNITNVEGLKIAFANKILPLLQEYFYNDYEKLGVLLGEDFFIKPITIDNKSLAKFFGSSLSSQYENMEQYQLKNVDELTKDAFLSIYQ